ncbi:hypothetical protein ACJX0J_019440, partial [Zea mays]
AHPAAAPRAHPILEDPPAAHPILEDPPAAAAPSIREEPPAAPSILADPSTLLPLIAATINDAEQACDFRITGSYHDGACTVSLGDSDTIITKANRPTVQRGERAAGEELVQRHRQPRDRLCLHCRARRHPRRDALPAMTRTLQFWFQAACLPFCCCVESTLAHSRMCPFYRREFKINVEYNHATLSRHCCHHELENAWIKRLLVNIDANNVDDMQNRQTISTTQTLEDLFTWFQHLA